MPDTWYAPRVVSPFRQVPFAALMVPLDIKRQYSDCVDVVIDSVSFFAEGDVCWVTIEFTNGSWAEWEINRPRGNVWQNWCGWRKSDSGDETE